MTSTSVTDPGPKPETTLGAFSDPQAQATPWVQAYDLLRRAQLYWVTTVRENGQPNVVPLLAVWALDGLCFCCGQTEQKHMNLQRNPHCVLTTGVNTLTGTDVVIEGVASLVEHDNHRRAVADAFESNYGWHLTSDEGTWTGMGDTIREGGVLVYRLRPVKGFAFGKGMTFSQTRYRWR